MAICWERAVPLAVHLCCFNFSAVLIVRVPFQFGVSGKMWNSIASVPDHCLFIYFQFADPLMLCLYQRMFFVAYLMYIVRFVFSPIGYGQ